MKKIMILEGILVCLLGFSGWYLADLNRKSRVPNPERLIENNKSLLFIEGSGVDVMGHFHQFTITDIQQVVAFLVRDTSFRLDLAFWKEVKRLLPKDAKISIIGYCNGKNCADTLRRETRLADFPVLEYGESTAMQAVVNADIDGQAWAKIVGHYKARRIVWRREGMTPNEFVRRLLQ